MARAPGHWRAAAAAGSAFLILLVTTRALSSPPTGVSVVELDGSTTLAPPGPGDDDADDDVLPGGDDADMVDDDDLWGIDDDEHTECANIDAYNGTSTCKLADDMFCDLSLGQASDSTKRLFVWLGCDSCDGEFAPCLMVRLGEIQTWCDKLAGNESLWADAHAQGNIEAVDDDGRRRALGARAASAPLAPSPTPLPTFDTDDTTACDAKAYCEECATSDTCTLLLNQAHAGKMKDVVQNNMDDISDEYWHAGQAYDMLVGLHYVCRFARAEGIVVPANTTRSGGRHPEDYSYGYSDGLEARRLKSQ